MSIQLFKAQAVDHTGTGTLTDGSLLYEVVTPDDERIADCTNMLAAYELARTLNAVLQAWLEHNPSDRTINVES